MESAIMNMKPPESIQHRYRRPPSPPVFDCSSLFNDFPFEPAPTFPPAPAILDDTESNMLDNFFTTMNSSPLDNNDFWFNFNDMPQDGTLGSGCNVNANRHEPQTSNGNALPLLGGFDWPDEVRPSMGLTTTLPSPPFHSNTASFHSRSIPKTVADSPQKLGNLSSDVLAAASMLYQNGSMPQYATHTYQNQQLQSVQPPLMGAPRSKRQKVGLNAPLAPSNITPPPSANTASPQTAVPVSASDIYFQNLAHATAFNNQDSDEAARVHRLPLRWGSDASFRNPRYAAPPDQPSIEDQTREMLKHLDCLEASQSPVATTRAPSPVRYPRTQSTASSQSVESPTSRGMRNLSLDDEITNASTPRDNSPQGGHMSKRRRSTKRTSDEELTSARQSPKYRRTSTATTSERPRFGTSDRRVTGRRTSTTSSSNHAVSANSRNSLPPSSASRRRSSSARVIRENLSEEQKRANHILSEQKRRDLIKNGFEDLCSLVPKLNGGGFSKSMMLVQAANWLEELLKGNDLLKRRLMAMDGRAAF